MTVAHAARPMPRVNAVNRPFWESCNAGALRIQRCAAPDCRKHVFYPRVCCPYCGHGALEWVAAAGRGTIVSSTFVHRPGHDAFLAEAPFHFIAVALEEGPLIYSRLDGKHPGDAPLIGRPVKVVFHAATAEQKLPYFALA